MFLEKSQQFRTKCHVSEWLTSEWIRSTFLSATLVMSVISNKVRPQPPHEKLTSQWDADGRKHSCKSICLAEARGKKWTGRLIYWCATFLMTQFMPAVSPHWPLLMPVPTAWLSAGLLSGVDEERKVDTRGREGRGAREPFHRLSGRIIGVLVKLR